MSGSRCPTSARQSAVAEAVLDVRGLRARYGRIDALHGVDLAADAGQCVAVLGPNGAGKSTLLNAVAGTLTPSGGCVHVAGQHVNGLPPHELARAGVCLIPERRGIFPNLDVSDHLRLVAGVLGRPLESVTASFLAQVPQLRDRLHQRAGTLSGGEQQLLAIGRAIVAEPAVLLLDELSTGLAPAALAEVYSVIDGLRRSGTAVVMVEQYTATALEMADRVVMLRQGTVLFTGTPSEVGPLLADAYLGASS